LVSLSSKPDLRVETRLFRFELLLRSAARAEADRRGKVSSAVETYLGLTPPYNAWDVLETRLE